MWEVNGEWERRGERKEGGGEIQTFKPCPWRTTRMTSASSLTLRPMQIELCECVYVCMWGGKGHHSYVPPCNVHTLSIDF